MKRPKLSLFIFIDALGWEVLQQHQSFLKGLADHRRSLKTILGYSSACDPSIISGLLPFQHLHWSCFHYSPHTCPYGWIRYLRFIPSGLTSNHRVRHRLSKLIKKIHGFTGYFQLYQLPFKYLPYFDYAEKYSIWVPKGLRRGQSIFDCLSREKIPYHIYEGETDDFEKLLQLEQAISRQDIEFAYVLLGRLDALMHAKGTQDPLVGKLLHRYHEAIFKLIDTAGQFYEDVALYVFTDHGMHDVTGHYDLQSDIDSLGLVFGQDYVATYDSTMARFWYLSDKARERILSLLNQLNVGKVLTDEELREFGVLFEDRMYGETIFLLESGKLIIPSHMGLKPIPGMHGYHPDDASSHASILSNRGLPEDLVSIEQIFWLMLDEQGLASPDNSDIPEFSWVRPLEQGRKNQTTSETPL